MAPPYCGLEWLYHCHRFPVERSIVDNAHFILTISMIDQNHWRAKKCMCQFLGRPYRWPWRWRRQRKFVVYSIILHHEWICFDVNKVVYTRLTWLEPQCTLLATVRAKKKRYWNSQNTWSYVRDTLSYHVLCLTRSLSILLSLSGWCGHEEMSHRVYVLRHTIIDWPLRISLSLALTLCSFEYWAINKWFRHGF